MIVASSDCLHFASGNGSATNQIISRWRGRNSFALGYRLLGGGCFYRGPCSRFVSLVFVEGGGWRVIFEDRVFIDQSRLFQLLSKIRGAPAIGELAAHAHTVIGTFVRHFCLDP